MSKDLVWAFDLQTQIQLRKGNHYNQGIYVIRDLNR
jgi:hypothetical protein